MFLPLPHDIYGLLTLCLKRVSLGNDFLFYKMIETINWFQMVFCVGNIIWNEMKKKAKKIK